LTPHPLVLCESNFSFGVKGFSTINGTLVPTILFGSFTFTFFFLGHDVYVLVLYSHDYLLSLLSLK